jgi:hypothetical protein
MTRHPLRLVRALRTVGSAAGVALVMVGVMT